MQKKSAVRMSLEFLNMNGPAKVSELFNFVKLERPSYTKQRMYKKINAMKREGFIAPTKVFAQYHITLAGRNLLDSIRKTKDVRDGHGMQPATPAPTQQPVSQKSESQKSVTVIPSIDPQTPNDRDKHVRIVPKSTIIKIPVGDKTITVTIE